MMYILRELSCNALTPLDILLLFYQDTNGLRLRYVDHAGHFGGCPAANKSRSTTSQQGDIEPPKPARGNQ
jgi:hypothetical protein